MTSNIESSPASVSERRGQILAPLQTNFSRPTSRPLLVTSPRAQRPRPEDFQNDSENNERVPLQATPVKRQTSKSGLRSLFGRDKHSRKQQANDPKLSGIDEVQQKATSGHAAPLSPTTTSTPTVVTSPTSDSYRPKPPPKPRGRPSDDKPATGEIGWKPPPLFQAYPQAIKHDTLPSPGMSAESILRIHATSAAKTNGSRDDDHPPSQDTPEDASARKKKEEKEKKKHLRSLSETISKTEWSQKVYVLATTGYIMQYSGSGKHDRLPEKMLQLGSKSVAFASDAIPGKHWVLQVSQTSEQDGSAPVDTHRPLFSRLGFHRSHVRRLARSFLLVFNSPEDLSSWLLAVRAQIEARGGKKYVSERVFDDEMEHELESKPRARQLVNRDPNRFSQTYQHPTIVPDEPNFPDQSRRSSRASINRRSIVMPSAPESRSQSISTTHTEMTSPVNGQGRFYSTIAAGNLPTLPPKNESAVSTVLTALDGSGSPTYISPTQRQSMQFPQTTAAMEAGEHPRPQSTVPDPILRSVSPPAPNFSVPSFSKRFAAKSVPSRMSNVPELGSMHRNNMIADPADIMSNFSSPPQSPGLSLNNLGQSEVQEQNRGGNHDIPLRKPLRVSSSQDSLADPQRSQDPRPHRYSRVPVNNKMVPPTTSHSSRPLTTINSEAAEPFTNTRRPSLASETGDLSARRDQQPLHRVSALPPTDASGRPTTGAPIPRRKSMPGLTVGPPALPPPNCPLPKIPSPIDPPPDGIEQFPFDRRSCISPPMKTGRPRRKSVTSSAQNSAHAPAAPGPSNGTRQSRVVNIGSVI